MRFEFNVKYGLNVLTLPINGGVRVTFRLKYGKNKIVIPTTKQVLFFVAKYGKNVIDIPETEVEIPGEGLFKSKVTIYNDIDADGVNPRRFDRKVIGWCNVQKGILQRADGTVEKVVNAVNVITKDVLHYRTPREYSRLPVDEREHFFTANVNDFVVYGEVDDVVTTAAEFRELQKKYKDNGFLVTSVNEFINGMSSVDNVQIVHA